MKSKFLRRFVLLFGVFFITTTSTLAGDLESVEFLSGYLRGDLDQKDDYEVIPLMVNFGFDLKPLARKVGIDTQGILEFQIEPFLNPVIGPDPNIEAGVGFLFKYAFPLTKRLLPYIRFGVAPSFISQHTREQSTQFNFMDYAGAGFNWFIKDNLALSCEYRYRHLSNASIKSPNKGIDTSSILLGVTFFFE